MVRRRLTAVLLLLAVFTAFYMLWLRNSFLVAVEQLRVEGATTEAEAVNAALASAARDMTTLNVDTEALARALERFPTVASISVEADFPHGLVVEVTERPPVGTISTGERLVAVSGDGLVLAGLSAGGLDLPSLEAESAPASGMLEGEARQQALVLGAAPEPLRPLVERSSFGPEGVEVRLRGGIELLFGSAGDAGGKWAAATAVLADPTLDALEYVDVRIPSRPAVGGATVPIEESAMPLVETPVAAATIPPETPVDPAAVPVDPAATVPADPATAMGPVSDPTATAAPEPVPATATPAPPPATSTGAVAP